MGLCLFGLTFCMPKKYAKIAQKVFFITLMGVVCYFILYVLQIKNIVFDVEDTSVVNDELHINLFVHNKFIFNTYIEKLAFLDDEKNEFEEETDAVPFNILPLSSKNVKLIFPGGNYNKIQIKFKTLLNSITLSADVGQ